MKDSPNEDGISVIICCYNSETRLKKTFAAIANQIFNKAIKVEIILVDNASTDNTSAYAEAYWQTVNSDISLKIVKECKPGLANARKMGIEESRYAFILFCDDDNWLFPNYINDVYYILKNNSEIGACGGMGIPQFETQKPYWFDEYAEAFAIGSQEIVRENGQLLNLYGAGLAIRRVVLTKLAQANFSQTFNGRVANKLSSSEDTELTNAVVLAGYQLHFSENLKFYHYIPKERLTFAYLQKLFLAFGKDGPVRNLYYAYISKRKSHSRIKNWYYHLLLSLIRLAKYSIYPPKKHGRLIYFNWSLAYIKELIRIKKSYNLINYKISKLRGIATDGNENECSASVNLAP